MSQISRYVNIHRNSRTKFLSIADFNRRYNGNLPENREVEKAFFNDLKKKRSMMFPVRSSALYPIAKKLNATETVSKRSKFSMRRRSKVVPDCSDCKLSPCECDDTPVRNVGMRLSNISISKSSVPTQMSIPIKQQELSHGPQRSKLVKAPGGLRKTSNQREGRQTHAGHTGGHKRHAHGHHVVDSSVITMKSTDNHATFSASDAKSFYSKANPEFLESHDIHEVVSAWNKAPIQDLLQSIRSKYGIAPKDQWSMEDVKAFYNHYEPDFLKSNNLHSVMNDWINVEPQMLKAMITERYGSCPGEPFKKINWNAQIVENYYNDVYPAKLQDKTSQEVVQEWNKFTVEEVMAACKSRYGVAPIPVDYEEPVAESHVERYRRQLEASDEHFEATKLLHFVPTNVSFGEFSSHAAKFKSSAARFLIDGKLGPYKMYNSEYKTFRSINASDVNNVMKAVKQNRSGDFFIRVTE